MHLLTDHGIAPVYGERAHFGLKPSKAPLQLAKGAGGEVHAALLARVLGHAATAAS